MNRPIPSALDLTRRQWDGLDCVWCGTYMPTGAVTVGRAEGHVGAVDLGIEVYACLLCAPNQAPTAGSRRRR